MLSCGFVISNALAVSKPSYHATVSNVYPALEVLSVKIIEQSVIIQTWIFHSLKEAT